MKVKRFARWSIFVLVLFCATIYLFRTPIVKIFAEKRIARYEKKYGFDVQFSGFKIKGIRNVAISNLSIKLPDGFVIVNSYDIITKLAFRELIFLQVNPLFIGFDSLQVNVPEYIVKDLGFSLPVDSTEQIINQRIDKTFDVKLILRSIRAILGISTADIKFRNLCINYSDSVTFFSIKSPTVQSENGNFSAIFHVNENDSINSFQIKGHSSKSLNTISFELSGYENSSVKLPLAEHLFGLKLHVDSLFFSVTANTLKSDSIHIYGHSNVSGFKAFHSKLLPTLVVIDSGSFRYGIGINSKIIEFDSTSRVTLNRFQLPFRFRIEQNIKPRIKFSASTGIAAASNLFESLPKGLFTNLQGIKVSGDIKFDINSDIDFSSPDSLKLDVRLISSNFKVLSYGNQDFSNLNDTLTYTVCQNDSVFKYIGLKPDYKYFREIQSISPLLVNAVVTAEDGGFWGHKGFDPEGFRYAMTQNIKQRRMARGGSTITMQLVKNIYLNQDKNLVRKAEEALIVWLIETQKIVEKNRILEIYLNIIEWGPCINGAAEASEYFFEKDPKDLTLSEAIFLASIIPKPNLFLQYFDDEGNLKPFMVEYYNFIATKMFERGQLTQDEMENVVPNVQLRGKSLDYYKLEKENVNTNSDVSVDIEIIEDPDII